MTHRPRAARKLEALNDLARGLLVEGRRAEAMQACIRSLRTNETAAAKALFVHLIKEGPAYEHPNVRQYLIRALTEPWCRTGQLVPASVALIARNGVVARCIERAAASWPAPLAADALFGDDGLVALAEDALFNALLENTPAAALALEHFLTLARRALLLHVWATQASETPEPSLVQFCCALARQCYINEYVYNSTIEEDTAVDRLRAAIVDAIAREHTVPAHWIALFACYAPLNSLPACERLASVMAQPPLSVLFAQQVQAPMQEKSYRASLARLTPADDATSGVVREQYEDHPYPRWVRTPTIEAMSYPEFLSAELGLDPSVAKRRGDHVDVLVAGCGTGQQSIQTAQRFPRARILAIDLSAASLAYAKRKTRELRITNVEYAQADISQLAAIDQSFDLIECVGVLHHLEDPLAGWRVLRSLLRADGIMRIGLYSALARRDIIAAQERIAASAYAASTEGIRQFRLDLQLLDRWRPFRWLTAMEDFYDTSGCRDLLFHAREHRFTLPEIKQALAALRLDFVKFNVAPDVRQRYSVRFPGELAGSDLNGWTQFELENPGTFLGMYNFYVRAAESREAAPL